MADSCDAQSPVEQPEVQKEPETTETMNEHVATIHSTSSAPEDTFQPEDSPEETVPSSELYEEQQPQESGTVSNLPDGWSEADDPASGRKYYFNSLTGETAWEPPSMPASNVTRDDMPSDSPNKEPDEAQSIDSTFDTLNAEFGIEPEETSNAVEATAATSYGEVLPEESSGNEDSNDVAASEEPANAEKMNPLPEGWIEANDPSTVQKYYYNSATGEVSWERPEPQPKDLADKAEYEYTTTTEEEQQQGTKEKEDFTNPIAETNGESSDSILPDDWIEAADPDSGRKYFYNSATGKVSWDRPG